jgi:hypothetical protein
MLALRLVGNPLLLLALMLLALVLVLLMRWVGGPWWTHLELLISLVQLGLELLDVALSSDQLVLAVLQSCAGVVEEV